MEEDSRETEAIIRRARGEDPEALGVLFARYTDRLLAMVELRLDRRLQGRVDPADILQETFLDASRSFPSYREIPGISFYVWLRRIAERQLIDVHRRHLGVQARDPRREISLDRFTAPEATSAAMADGFLATLDTPSAIAIRIERTARLQEALGMMDPIDREVLALRHFEQLSNLEAAAVLGITESAATKRHLRALLRLRQALGPL